VVPQEPKVTEVLPLLYLHGLSTGDFVPALEAFFGSTAGLSAAAVGRLLVPGRPTIGPSVVAT
jgi:putative transposase